MSAPSGEAKRWFYVREGRRLGPVETARLVDLVLSGEVSEDALVWHTGLPEWLKARDAEEIRRELPPPVPVSPPPRPPVSAVPSDAGADPDDGEGETLPDGVDDAAAGGSEVQADGSRRRKRRKRRHRDAKKRPAWLWPLVAVLVVLMVFLWWLLRRMNEVPPGRIIQTGALEAPYRVLPPGREPRTRASVTSRPLRLTTSVTLSPGFDSPSA